MGSTTFYTLAHGKTPNDAFRAAREQACYEHGHGGYSGTIAEKDGFTVIRESAKVIKERAAVKARKAKAKLAAEKARKPVDPWGVYDAEEEYRSARAARDSLKASMTRRKTGKAKDAQAAHEIAYALVEMRDRRIDDKWGDAGCIPVDDGSYLFFGWASE